MLKKMPALDGAPFSLEIYDSQEMRRVRVTVEEGAYRVLEGTEVVRGEDDGQIERRFLVLDEVPGGPHVVPFRDRG